jgi:hypothetical protein
MGSPASGACPCAAGPNPAAAKAPESIESGLVLRLEQVPSPSRVSVRMTLTNTARDRRYWLNARPDFGRMGRGPRYEEIEMVIVDVHHRAVVGPCLDDRVGAQASEFRVLLPGDSLQLQYEFDPFCYSLAPGETLEMRVSYMSLGRWPKPEPGSYPPERPIMSLWQKIVVPLGWKDKGGSSMERESSEVPAGRLP